MRLSELKAREQKVDLILQERELRQFIYNHSHRHSNRAFMGLFLFGLMSMVLIVFVMNGGI